ncbi:hypothetical protein G7Y89_g6680 [Cudoniella acicularis]|uniref:2EXR domain-containing protein n=1 Tax=Cudoniella acicularis TaxID=354080 RepID=A0A8H4W2S7_9HELO|nr:hypothetical protein G7Y89_g6680 [Cudoniella acicularis]
MQNSLVHVRLTPAISVFGIAIAEQGSPGSLPISRLKVMLTLKVKGGPKCMFGFFEVFVTFNWGFLKDIFLLHPVKKSICATVENFETTPNLQHHSAYLTTTSKLGFFTTIYHHYNLNMEAFALLPDPDCSLFDQCAGNVFCCDNLLDIEKSDTFSCRTFRRIRIFAFELPDPGRILFLQASDNLDKFELFPNLPIELRLQIWEYATFLPNPRFQGNILRSKVWSGSGASAYFLPKQSAPPATISVNFESRQTILKQYFKAFWGIQPGFDPKRDALRLSLSFLDHYQTALHCWPTYWVKTHLSDRPDFRETVETMEVFGISIGCSPDDNRQNALYKTFRQIMFIVTYFRNLREIRLDIKSCEDTDCRVEGCKEAVLVSKLEVESQLKQVLMDYQYKFGARVPQIELLPGKWYSDLLRMRREQERERRRRAAEYAAQHNGWQLDGAASRPACISWSN